MAVFCILGRDKVMEILIQYGADVNAVNNHKTALHHAVEQSNINN